MKNITKAGLLAFAVTLLPSEAISQRYDIDVERREDRTIEYDRYPNDERPQQEKGSSLSTENLQDWSERSLGRDDQEEETGSSFSRNGQDDWSEEAVRDGSWADDRR